MKIGLPFLINKLSFVTKLLYINKKISCRFLIKIYIVTTGK